MFLIYFLIAFCLIALGLTKKLDSSAILANVLKETSLKRISGSRLESALKEYGATSKTLKSVDRFTKPFRFSLTRRIERFLNAPKQTKREAEKLWEYVHVVERGLQAIEILEAIREELPQKRKQLLSLTNLIEIKRQTLLSEGINHTISVLKLCKTEHLDDGNNRTGDSSTMATLPGDILVAIVPQRGTTVDLESTELLKLLSLQKPITLSTSASVLKDSEESDAVDEVSVQPMLFHTSLQAMKFLSSHLFKTSQKSKDMKTFKKKLLNFKPKVHFLGYSSGGAVAGYCAMLFDGLLEPKCLIENDEERDDSSQLKDEINRLLKDRAISKSIGLLSGCVSGMAIGLPPCISRNIIPSYFHSVINGDDVIGRASYDTMAKLSSRIASSVPSSGHTVGNGRKNQKKKYKNYKNRKNSVWTVGKFSNLVQKRQASLLRGARSYLTGVKSIAVDGLRQYSSGVHDLSSLQLPGSVFYLPHTKKSTCIQQVLRGTLREDMLWQLHDVMPSQEMFEHHQLLSYYDGLSKC